MSRITCLRKICFGLFTALIFSALSSVAMAGDFAANLSSPATNTSGNYTVTWTGGTYYSLQEKKNSGNWTNVYSGTGSSKYLTGRGAGTYKYRMNWYFCFPFMNQCFNLYSEEVTTVVNVPVPSTPGGISGPGSASYTTSSGASYSLSWGASTGTVTNYQFQEKINSGGWATVQNTTTRSKSFSGKNAATYYYRVRACNGGSCSGFTSTKTVTVTASYLVSASTSSTSSGNFSLSWTVPGSFTTYQVEQSLNGGSWGIVASTGSPSHSFSNKPDGSYQFRIKYCFTLPISPYSTVCSATSNSVAVLVAKPPGMPSSIGGVPATDNNGAFTVSWGTGSGTVTSYKLYQQKNSGSWAQIYSGTGTSKAVSGLGDGTYKYRVRACNSVGCSSYRTSGNSIVANVPPTPSSISGVPATDNNGAFTVSWPTTTNADNYRLEQQKNGGSWTQIYNSTGISKAVSGLADGTYKYRVRACNTYSTYTTCSGYRTSGNSVVANMPGTPASIAGVPATDNNGAFTVSWGTGSGPVDNYRLEQQKNGGSWTQIHSGSTSILSKAVSSLGDGTYKYRVRACNTFSTYTACSGYRTSGNAIVANAPGTPPSISGVPTTDNNGAFTVSWGASSGTVDAYHLYQKTNSGSYAQIYTGTATSFAVTGLADATYTYRVRARNTYSTYAAYSGYRTSNSVLVQNTPGNPGSISGPGSASYSSSGGASYSLSWAASSGNISAYELQEQINSGSWTTVQTSTALSKPFSGKNEATYKYRVRACNGGSCTAYGAQKTVAVTANYSLSSSTSNSTNGSFSLSWTNPNSHPIFQVEEKFNSGSWTLISQKTTASHSLSNKPNGTYNYRIQYCITLPISPYSTVCSATSNSKQVVVAVPAPSQPTGITGPSSLNYSVPGGVDYSIDWADSTGTVTVYDLERKVNSGNWADVLPANTSSARSFNDDLAGSYQYRVRACNGLSCSAYSSTKTVTVTANYTLTASPAASSNGNLSLSWTNPSPSTTFQIEEQVGSGSWNLIGSTGSTTFSPPSKADGTYNYRIQYCFTLPIPPYNTLCTETSNTDQVVVTHPPGIPPSIATPGGDDNGAFSVSWAAASGISPSYTLERENNGSGIWTSIYTGTSLITNVVTGLADGSYKFRVKACNVGGCSAPKISTVTLVANKPGVPGTVTGDAGTVNQSVALSWPAATGNVDKYTLQQRFNGGIWTTIQDSNVLSKAVAGITDGTYDFQVRACNNYSTYTSCSNYTSTYKTVTALHVGIPGNISGPSNDPLGTYLLTWAAPAGTATSYTLQQRQNSGTWSTIYTGATNSFGPQSLADATYDYRVKGCNARGCSGYTSNKTVVVNGSTTPPSTPPGPFNPNPTSLVSAAEIAATDNAGVSGGSFRVDESGSATYSMPIMTVAGTAGVVPEVSLNYSSNGGNGIAGLGWNIGGLSAVSRCRQTLHQDGAAKPITFTAMDRFCLDGQRLILVSGTYGAANSIYKTEIDSFAKIEAFGGTTGHPDYWKVYRKDGSTSTYGWGGTNKDSELEGWDGTTKSGKVASWAIKQLLDSANNQIVFTYSNDADGFRATQLRYAYAGSTDITAAGNARVRFEYENRDDQSHSYMAGYSIYKKKRLSKIISENNIATTGTNWKEVRSYKLNYLAALTTDKLSRLDNIEECIGSNCLPNNTSFSWSLPVAGESYSNSDTSFTMKNLVTYQLADFNGDGKSDIVWVKHKNSGDDQGLQVAYGNDAGTSLTSHSLFDHNGTATTSIHYDDDPAGNEALKLFPLDYNADGRSDLAVYSYRDQFGHTAGWHLYLSEFNSLSNSWILTFQGDLDIKDEHAAFADLNSDGLVDAISDDKVYYLEHNENPPAPRTEELVTSNKYYEFVYKHDVDIGSFPADIPLPTLPSEIYSFEGFKTAGADFNGDGKADGLAIIKKRITEIGNGNPDPFNIYSVYAISIRINQGIVNGKQTFTEMDAPLTDDDFYSGEAEIQFNLIQTPDINGDGLSDLVYYKNSEFHYALSDGTELNYIGALFNAGGLDDAKKHDFSMADVNRDGFPDAIWHDFSGSYGYILARKWNPKNQQFDAPLPIRNGVGDNKDESHVYFDYNADTITDYINFKDNKFEVYQGNGANQPVNRITSITNGLGAVTDITYETLGHSDHYTHLDATYTDTTQQTCTADLSNFIQGGGGVIEYNCPQTTIDLNGFYTALNGDWDLPSGTHSLGKQGNPVLELNGPMYVVTDVESSAPAAHNSNPGQVDNSATSSISYHYGEAKIQAMGRGMLGFKTLTTIDNQTAVTTRTTYRQDFPFIGQPLSTKVYSGEGHLLGESTNDIKLTGWNGTGTPANSYYQPYTHISTDKSYSLANNGASLGSLLQTATTTSVYDSDGNATSITVETVGGGKSFEKVVTNSYTAAGFTSAESKRLGRLSSTQVVTKRDENSENGNYQLTDTRNSSFTYITSGNLKGLLQTETIEPGTAFEHTITHSYDSFGNKVKAETTAIVDGGSTPQTRFSRSEYDSTGRYVTETYELFSIGDQNDGLKVSEVISRNDYGAATETRTWVDDNNYVTSKASYTPFGIKYFESNSSGAYSINTLASGTGSQCPSGTVFHSRSQTAGGGESQQCFDKLGRSIRKAAKGFSGTWSYSDTEYDSIGRVKRQSEPYFAGQTSCNSTSHTSKCWASIDYDILGRPTSATAPDGSVSTTAYNGLSTVSTNALNHDKTETKNVLGEMVSVTDNLNSTTSYGYDAQGNLVTMTDSANNSTTLVYDKLGRKTSMSDPDKGNWSYVYNGFGELIEQTDAKGQKSELSYDVRGRLKTRIDKLANGTVEADTLWVYDTGLYGRGQLYEVDDSLSDYKKSVEYDSLGRLVVTGTRLSVSGVLSNHYEKITYDQYGRTFQVFDAARSAKEFSNNGTQNHYNSHGYLHKVTSAEQLNGQPASTYHTIQSMDARGNIVSEELGNGVTRSATYEHNTGLLQNLQANLGVSTFQNLDLQWDEVGNLEQRKETGNGRNLTENFLYDGLNRLTSSQVVGSSAQTLTYNAIGNITHKSDVGSYSYGAGNAGPHAVTSAGGQTYAYDANGNNISGDGRTISYTSFDKPSQIIKGSHKVEFEYGPDRNRYRRTDTNTGNGRVTDTLYIGSVEKITNPDGSKEWKRTIGNIVIKQVFNSSGTQTAKTEHYILKDHLGSPSVIMDKVAQVQQTMDFDPWGARRNTNWAAMSSTELTNTFFKNHSISNSVGTDSITSRGFTGHEMLDEVGIIHMNGRIYDAKLGRFLQADPIIQAPYNTQSLNRYSYTVNNPLNAVDPSGFSFFKTLLFIVKIVVAVVLTFACGGVCGPWVWAGVFGTIGAFEAKAFGGNVLTGAISGAIAGYLGGSFIGETMKLGAFAGWSALNGGITSALNGGKFGHGFVAAGAGAYIGSKIGGFVKGAGNALRNTGTFIAKVTLGGAISKLTGGKFANGAGYAAFSAAVSYSMTASSPEVVVTGRRGGSDKPPSSANDSRVVKPEINFDKPFETSGAAKEALNADILAAKENGNNQWEYGGVSVQKTAGDHTLYYNSEIVTSMSSDWIAWNGTHLLQINAVTPIVALHHYHPLTKAGHGLNRTRGTAREFSRGDMSTYKYLKSNGTNNLQGVYMVDKFGTRVYRGGRRSRGVACTEGIASC